MSCRANRPDYPNFAPALPDEPASPSKNRSRNRRRKPVRESWHAKALESVLGACEGDHYQPDGPNRSGRRTGDSERASGGVWFGQPDRPARLEPPSCPRVRLAPPEHEVHRLNTLLPASQCCRRTRSSASLCCRFFVQSHIAAVCGPFSSTLKIREPRGVSRFILRKDRG